jgi:D-alanine transaminase
MIVYFNGRFMEKENVSISPDDRGFLFADGLYEVIRSYEGKLFRPGDHIDRLNYGARHLRLSRTDFSEFIGLAHELLLKNDLLSGDATVYFQVTRGSAKRSHAFPINLPELTVYATASRFDASKGRQNMANGIKAITVPDQRWARCDMKTTALTANILANQMAVESDAKEAIFVRDGVMLEGTHSNFMAVMDNVLVTAPISNYILGGITRKAVVEICKKAGIPMVFAPVFENNISLCQEMLVVGTTLEVSNCQIERY